MNIKHKLWKRKFLYSECTTLLGLNSKSTKRNRRLLKSSLVRCLRKKLVVTYVYVMALYQQLERKNSDALIQQKALFGGIGIWDVVVL